MSHRSFTIYAVFVAVLAVLPIGSISCRSSAESTKYRQVATKPLKQVQEENNERLMSIPGVLGVLTGDIAGKPCIRVLVQRRTMATAKDIPSSIDGYPVIIEEGRSFRTR